VQLIRVGLGYDAHRFAGNRRLMLGGVEIPFDRGLEGHSDADVVLHALTDAILGAAGCGDIGEHFPPDDETWRDADSGDLLSRSLVIVGADWHVGNADIVVIAETPKIAPYRTAMRDRISQILRVEPSLINIKATTNERMGFIGRSEGIAALATVTLNRADG
jgi:2-C-methyl-D-erythritol 2,4-cyclodiphosphate synthase